MGRTGGFPRPRTSRSRARRWAALLAISVALGAGACGAATPAPDDAAIRIGMSAWPGNEPLYLAQEVGIYDDLGIDVEIVEFTSASDAARAFVHGQIDGLASTIVELLTLQDRDIDARAVLQLDYSEGGDLLMVDESIGAVADLAGKAVAVEPASIGILILDQALRDAGVDPDDVELELVDQLEMPALARSGLVQGVVTYVPRSFQVEDESGFRPIFTSADMPEPVNDVLSFDQEIIDSRGDDVTLVVEAWSRAIAFAAEDTDRAVRIMSAREGIDPSRFLASLDLMRVLSLSEQRDLFATGRIERSCNDRRRELIRIGAISRSTLGNECTDDAAILAATERQS